ncbi:DUF2189 domain-containing protein [Aurantimonas coralicida]|uniref:DUF2189 domain-containing protein n=1 Tax=Aurantimonas coralicida TaxID=182270 RepID=UPI002386ABCD|nr:DUF2189 domain-containing protein [Aurantimonas coralicida]MDE0924020.1 DUF2189 domain-containing protein [Aurantimonas coralicida]
MTTAPSIPHLAETIGPDIRRIGAADLVACLKAGIADFTARPTHYAFLCLVYPLMGLAIGVWAADQDILPLIFPLVAGFALIGPVAAIPLYEISRRRERGLDASWSDAFEVLRSPALPSILGLASLLLLIFVAWLYAAQAIYIWLYGSLFVTTSYGAFLGELLTTTRGWTLIGVGNLVGLGFALVTLAITVVSFPLLLDRHGGVAEAMATSVRVMLHNPGTVLLWGLMVAGLVFAGSLPLLIGLPIVLPVLGHASWHLYRRAVAPAGG